MNERLQKFLEVKKLLKRIDYEEEKEKTLIELGLYEKVYSPDNTYSEEFSSSEWNSVDLTTKYFKKVPIEITDVEFEEVKRYATQTYENKNNAFENNSVAKALTIIAYFAIIVGFISCFIFSFAYLCVGLISGTIFLGFAEIIKLLNDIKNKWFHT